VTDDNLRKARQEDKERQLVVSVRFPEGLLQRVHAFAAVRESTANAVIREAVEDHIRRVVRTPEFQEASQAHVQRAQAAVAALSEDGDTAVA
jgi:predicted transcriptional regulator